MLNKKVIEKQYQIVKRMEFSGKYTRDVTSRLTFEQVRPQNKFCK